MTGGCLWSYKYNLTFFAIWQQCSYNVTTNLICWENECISYLRHNLSPFWLHFLMGHRSKMINKTFQRDCYINLKSVHSRHRVRKRNANNVFWFSTFNLLLLKYHIFIPVFVSFLFVVWQLRLLRFYNSWRGHNFLLHT